VIGVRRSMVFGLFVLLILGVAPAWAQDAQTTEAFVVLSGRADVPQGQQVGDLVVFHGSSTVDGTVDGSLTAFDAPVTISGRVNGDVVVFNGRVELRSGANVNWEGFGWAGRLAWWLAVSVSTLVVGLVLVWLLGRGAAWILEAGDDGSGVDTDMGSRQLDGRGTLHQVQPGQHGRPGLPEVELPPSPSHRTGRPAPSAAGDVGHQPRQPPGDVGGDLVPALLGTRRWSPDPSSASSTWLMACSVQTCSRWRR
jgi:hypothetical protein